MRGRRGEGGKGIKISDEEEGDCRQSEVHSANICIILSAVLLSLGLFVPPTILHLSTMVQATFMLTPG